VGAIGVAVGTWAGLTAISENRSGESECDASGCSSRGLARIHDAGTKADLSTVAFAVGAAGLLGGTYFVVTASPAQSHGIRQARVEARVRF
jgi:hypothetical protein